MLVLINLWIKEHSFSVISLQNYVPKIKSGENLDYKIFELIKLWIYSIYSIKRGHLSLSIFFQRLLIELNT
jgi:hypothetical protein